MALAEAFNSALQGSLDRQQRREARRASNRIRRRRIAERARRHQAQRKLERMQMILGNRADRRQRRRTTVEVPTDIVPGAEPGGTIRVTPEVAAELKEKSQTQPRETIEVRREDLPELPGTGPANVDPDTLIRHGHEDMADGQTGSSADGGGGAPTSGVNPSTPQEARQVLKDRIRQEQAAGEAGVPKDSLASIQEDIRGAKTALDSMTTGRPDFTELRQKVMADTTDAPADTADAAGPTSSTDSTTTRGLGGRPDGTFVPAGQLGMTTGGVGGGGANEPQPSIMALRAQAMGAADMGEVDDSTLVDRAFTVAVERSPQEAQRRLDGLVQQGSLDPARRDTILKQVEQKRRTAFDGLQGLRGGQ